MRQNFTSCGIFYLAEDPDSGYDCIDVYTILIGGPAIPLSLIILGLLCILCCVGSRSCRKRKRRSKSPDDIGEEEKMKEGRHKESLSTSGPQAGGYQLNELTNDEDMLDAGLYDTVDRPVKVSTTKPVSNSSYQPSGNAQKYDYISHTSSRTDHALQTPEITTTQVDENCEPRPYEEFVKQEQPVYATPNKKQKGKNQPDKEAPPQSHLRSHNSPTRRTSMPPQQMPHTDNSNRLSLNFPDSMYSSIGDTTAPPLPPPLDKDNIPCDINPGEPVIGTVDGQSDQKVSCGEGEELYKNVTRERRQLCRSSGDFIQKNSSETFYYDRASRDFSGSGNLCDQPTESGIESGENNMELYMNV